MRGLKTRKPEPTIPVASMADIAMLLVIFFLVTSTLQDDQGLSLEVPDMKRETPASQLKQKQIDIDRRGVIIYRGRDTTLENLSLSLQQEMQPAREVDEKLVLLVADKGRPVKEIAAVADVVKGAGGIVVLVTEEGSQTPESPGLVKATP